MIALLLALAATTTDGSSSGLPPAELAKLKKETSYRLLLPTAIPKGFKFVSQSLDNEHGTFETFSWWAQWKHPKTKATLTIQMASDGLGDPIIDDEGPAAKEKSLKSGMFGDVTFLYTPKRFASYWFEVPGQTYPRVGMVLGEGLSVDEGIKVFRSLRWYKPSR